MRQRRIKNEEDKLKQSEGYLIENPIEHKGIWRELFNNDNEIYVEFGCGKGKFIINKAMQNPDKNFIAIEGRGSVIIRALEKAMAEKIPNVFFVREYVKDAREYFENDEVSGIYLNFSDPWPKDRHAKRRLTHNKYLQAYKDILKEGKFIEFKTDNDSLFEFAVSEFKTMDFEFAEFTRDLHNTEFSEKNVTTEYEDKFKAIGKNINYFRALAK